MSKLIPEELDELIQESLSDGVLTAKEKMVILSKAEKMGLDVNEVDVYLDSKYNMIKLADQQAATRAKGATCPFCGKPVPPMTDQCPACGESITPQASKEVEELIEALENALVNVKSMDPDRRTYEDIRYGRSSYKENMALVDKNLRKAEMYYGSNPKIQKLIAAVKEELELMEKDRKKKQLKKFLANDDTQILIYFGLMIILTALGCGIAALCGAFK